MRRCKKGFLDILMQGMDRIGFNGKRRHWCGAALSPGRSAPPMPDHTGEQRQQPDDQCNDQGRNIGFADRLERRCRAGDDAGIGWGQVQFMAGARLVIAGSEAFKQALLGRQFFA